ncbi:hypothetical protein LTR95_000954 [Oleoguttula sp. CCFEE 5521]
MPMQIRKRIRSKDDKLRPQATRHSNPSPQHLEAIWTAVETTVANTPGLVDISEPQLFFSAKGTKLHFKTGPSRPTLLNAMDNFRNFFEEVLDPAFIKLDRCYVDIGKEICPWVSEPIEND